MDTNAIIVYITASNEEEAARIAHALVSEQLAACVNIIKNIRSVYSWQGRIEDDSEALMVVKTQGMLFHDLSARVKALHSYEVPEIIAVPVIDGSAEYLKWLHESTREKQ